ncbi:MAG: glucosaminidase domain-containing protein [Chloroflexaceae bacterium]|nr:glucosaminidase domain-containing protein [Chloroflexaceae bacterium]
MKQHNEERPRSAPPMPLAEELAGLDDLMPMHGVPAVPPRPQPARRDVAVQTQPRTQPSTTPARRDSPRPARSTTKTSQDKAGRGAASNAIDLSRQSEQETRQLMREADWHAERDLEQAGVYVARPYMYAERSASRAPAMVPTFQGIPSNTMTLLIVFVASVVIILTLGFGGNLTVFSNWAGSGESSASTNSAANVLMSLFAQPRPAGDSQLQGPPSITPQQIDQILAAYNSPAVGTGQDWYDLGKQYNIDPAWAVAFFIHESSAGTAPGWAGWKPDGSNTHNVGNIICAGYSRCHGRFRDYGSWNEGIKDWYRLISVEYIQGRGHQTIADVIPVYAPAFENDVQNYVNVVQRLVDGWRTNGVR